MKIRRRASQRASHALEVWTSLRWKKFAPVSFKVRLTFFAVFWGDSLDSSVMDESDWPLHRPHRPEHKQDLQTHYMLGTDSSLQKRMSVGLSALHARRTALLAATRVDSGIDIAEIFNREKRTQS